MSLNDQVEKMDSGFSKFSDASKTGPQKKDPKKKVEIKMPLDDSLDGLEFY